MSYSFIFFSILVMFYSFLSKKPNLDEENLLFPFMEVESLKYLTSSNYAETKLPWLLWNWFMPP